MGSGVGLIHEKTIRYKIPGTKLRNSLFTCNRYRCRICLAGCTTEMIHSIFGGAQVAERHPQLS
jgi:hypothetical protein